MALKLTSSVVVVALASLARATCFLKAEKGGSEVDKGKRKAN